MSTTLVQPETAKTPPTSTRAIVETVSGPGAGRDPGRDLRRDLGLVLGSDLGRDLGMVLGMGDLRRSLGSDSGARQNASRGGPRCVSATGTRVASSRRGSLCCG